MSKKNNVTKETLHRVWSAIDRRELTVVPPKTMFFTGGHAAPVTIFAPALREEARAAWKRVVCEDVRADRAAGSLVGLALGDAYGAPLEFIAATCGGDQPSQMVYVPSDGTITYYGGMNKFRLQRGQWTDDTSMALCLADSLLARNGYDGGDCRVRYHGWWHHGYNNAFRFEDNPRPSVGLGGNISKSLAEVGEYGMRPSRDVPPMFHPIGGGEDAGNGSIMRNAPVPLRYWADPTEAYRVSCLQSRATHPGNDAAACCAFLTFFVASAVSRRESVDSTLRDFVDVTVNAFLASLPATGLDSGMAKVAILLQSIAPDPTEGVWDWRKETLAIASTLEARGRSYNGYPVSAGYFGAYCMDGLAMALWAMRWAPADNFAMVLQKVVNLCGDADTTGAICGQMAGAYYGYCAMRRGPYSSEMVLSLRQWDPSDEIPLRGVLLYLAGDPQY